MSIYVVLILSTLLGSGGLILVYFKMMKSLDQSKEAWEQIKKAKWDKIESLNKVIM